MRHISRLAAGIAVGFFAASASAQAFPERPVSIIVPWAAGGGTDTVVRIFAAGFEQELGVSVNVINRPGGGGVAGHTDIVNAEPDGYTLGAASPEITFYRTLGLAEISLDDLSLFSRLAIIPAGVTVAASSEYESIEQLISAIEEAPEGTYSSSGTGVGGSWHIAAGGMLREAGIDPQKLRWVPSQGGTPALQDLVAGGISMFTGSPVEAQGLIDAGQVRVLAVMLDERSPAFPEAPTLREALDIDWTYANWFALVGPSGIPDDIRDQLYEAATRAHAREDVQQNLRARGIMPVWDEPEEFREFAQGFAERARIVLEDLDLAR